MNKSERQAALARIINQKPIATQEELLAALKAAGIDATQATISRDIRCQVMVICWRPLLMISILIKL